MSNGTLDTSTAPAPTTLPRWLPLGAWISFVLNVLIIGTGGAVRLTGSGLGCDTWPKCTSESFIHNPEMGIHSMIEFGNRTITGPLLLSAVFVLILTWRLRAQRRDLFVLSWLVLGLVILQAIVGGFVVWEELAAGLVGFHYTVSVIIVCIAAAYLVRMREPAGPRELAVPKLFMVLTHVMTLVFAITLVVGVVTTANGPHSGDENVVRDGFDATLLAHIHAWPGYALLALLLGLMVWAAAQKLRPLRWLIALLAGVLVQVLVGVYQARNGLPPFAVGVHMVLAAITAAATTVVVLRLKRPVK